MRQPEMPDAVRPMATPGLRAGPEGALPTGDADAGEPEAAAGEPAAPDAGAAGAAGGFARRDRRSRRSAVWLVPLVGVGVADPPTMLQPATKVIAAIRATAVSDRLRIRASSSRDDAGERTL